MEEDEGRTVSMAKYTLACNQASNLQAALQQAQEERDEARGHWTRAERGWNRAILRAEGFQRDYLSAIERGKLLWWGATRMVLVHTGLIVALIDVAADKGERAEAAERDALPPIGGKYG
jgi:hypothetical protein